MVSSTHGRNDGGAEEQGRHGYQQQQGHGGVEGQGRYGYQQQGHDLHGYQQQQGHGGSSGGWQPSRGRNNGGSERHGHGYGGGTGWGPPRARRADKSSWWRWSMAVVFTVLAILVLLAAVAVLLVVLVLQPRVPYLAVQTATLSALVYDQQAVLDYAELDLTVVAANRNRAHGATAGFSDLQLRIDFHGTMVAVLTAEPFEVAPRGALPLPYVARTAKVPLDGAGRAAMARALQDGVVPFGVNGQARTRWRIGGFVAIKYWTRLACEIRFFWPNGSALHFTCNSKSKSRY